MDQVAQWIKAFGIPGLNEMQLAAWAAIRAEQAVVLLGPTGSGKTLAFLLPVAAEMEEVRANPQCLVLVPTRELALQVAQTWKKMGTGLKVTECYGGHAVETEINNLAEPPALLVGTPGRIRDHLLRNSFAPTNIHTLVLDEFDKCLEFGFEEDMQDILLKLPALTRRVLVSATALPQIPGYTGILNPVPIDFLGDNPHMGLVRTLVLRCPEKDKLESLVWLLCKTGAEPAIIFCNHREAVERVHLLLEEHGIESTCYHGGMDQAVREKALARFRNGSTWFLVATDIAARGLDIMGVQHIIHYHLPHSPEEFIHRNGRTARQQHEGTAWILLHPEEHAPDWLHADDEMIPFTANYPLPPAAPWTTFEVFGGKKDKINKTDLAGFFHKAGQLEKDDVGMIEVKDYVSLVAVKRSKSRGLMQKIRDEKIKGRKFKIYQAR